MVGGEDLSFPADTSRAAGRGAGIRHLPSFQNWILSLFFKSALIPAPFPPPCKRLGAVSKHLRQPPAPPFVQYSESIKFPVELALLYDVAALTPY